MVWMVFKIIAIVAMAQLSGIWEVLDAAVSRRWPLHHLPHICMCGYCQGFWLTAAWLFFWTETGPVSSVFWALVAAEVYKAVPVVIGLVSLALTRLAEKIGGLLDDR